MTDHSGDSVPTGLLAASSAITADALDSLGLRDQVMDAAVRPVFPQARLVGRVYPVNVVVDLTEPDEPYAGEMDALSAMGPGDVGVYAVQDGSNAAAWGELFSCAAIGRGVAGVVVDGCVRDVRQISELGYPVFSRGMSPLDTRARARVSDHGEPVVCAGLRVSRGDVVVADVDGIVVVPAERVDEVAGLIASKHRLEHRQGSFCLICGLDC